MMKNFKYVLAFILCPIYIYCLAALFTGIWNSFYWKEGLQVTAGLISLAFSALICGMLKETEV